MNKLLMSRQKKSIAWFLAIAVVMVYSLPVSIFAEDGANQKMAERVSEGDTFIYDGNGKPVDGEKDLSESTTGVVALSKKITELPTKENPNQFEITLEFKTKPQVKSVKEYKDSAVVLVVDVSKSMNEGLQSKTRLDIAKGALNKFLDEYSQNANGKKRMVSLIKFGTDAELVSDWVNVADSVALNNLKTSVNKLKAKDATNIAGALRLANNVINDEQIKTIDKDLKHVVVLTDGAPTAYFYEDKVNGKNPIKGETTTLYMDNLGSGGTRKNPITGNFEDSTSKFNLYATENRVSQIKTEIEKLNESAKTRVILYSDEMTGKMTIYQNKVANLRFLKAYDDLLKANNALKEKAKEAFKSTETELKNKDKELENKINILYGEMQANLESTESPEEKAIKGGGIAAKIDEIVAERTKIKNDLEGNENSMMPIKAVSYEELRNKKLEQIVVIENTSDGKTVRTRALTENELRQGLSDELAIAKNTSQRYETTKSNPKNLSGGLF